MVKKQKKVWDVVTPPGPLSRVGAKLLYDSVGIDILRGKRIEVKRI